MSNQLQPLGSYHIGVAMGYSRAHEDYIAHGAAYTAAVAADEQELRQLAGYAVSNGTDDWSKRYIRGYRRAYKHYAHLAMCSLQGGN